MTLVTGPFLGFHRTFHDRQFLTVMESLVVEYGLFSMICCIFTKEKTFFV